MRLVALGPLTYAGAALVAGDEFEASDSDAFILINATRPLAREAASEADRDPPRQPVQQPPAPPASSKPARRRTYRHADMKAATGA